MVSKRTYRSSNSLFQGRVTFTLIPCLILIDLSIAFSQICANEPIQLYLNYSGVRQIYGVISW